MSNVAVVLAVLLGVGSGGSWPQFRGPGASGIGSGNTPVTWNVESGQNVKWKVPVSGLAHSSPIVWSDRIYLASAVPQVEAEATVATGWMGGGGESANDASPWAWKVICLSNADGKQLWEATAHTGVPKQKRHIKATHCNGTPAADGKHVVAFFGSEGLFCFDIDGKQLWKVDLGILEVGPARTDMQWGSATSPIIHEGKVYLQCDARNTQFWASFDVTNGKELKRVLRSDDSTWSTPNICTIGTTPQLVCNGFKEAAGYDLNTGERLWFLNQAGGDIPVPTPLIDQGLIYLTNAHGGKASFAIKPDARGDLTPKDDQAPEGLAWWKRGKGSYMPTPLVMDGLLYIGDDDGRLRCMDFKTGSEHYATRLSSSGTTFSASPVAANGKLYFTSEDGDIFVVKAGTSFELLATNAMNEICMATPAISDGVLLVRTQKHLYAIAGP